MLTSDVPAFGGENDKIKRVENDKLKVEKYTK